MAEDHKILWQKCLDIIRDNIGQEHFDIWFSFAKSVSYDNNLLTINIPSLYIREIYESRFEDLIQSTLRRVYGPNIDLRYNVGLIRGDNESNVTLKSPKPSPILTNPVERQRVSTDSPFNHREKEDELDSNLNKTYNFENYCVGESNKLPFTIAEYIAKNPDKSEFNPFFLYGDVGVGKTHLIQAIGTRLKENNPRLKVLYVTMRIFQNQQSIAAMKKVLPEFINFYQTIDVLLIDDIQELGGKKGTMDALFPIFQHLQQHGKKLIFTCDRPPKDLDGVADRLIDRFKWGITEKLPKPDFELRRKILISKALRNGLDIPENIINLIAKNVTGSVRELEGVVLGLYTRAITLGQPISEGLARSVMKNFVQNVTKKSINFDMIVETTAEHCNVNPDVIFSKNRMRDIADARQVIMYLANKHTDLSSPAIGSRLNRTHATVLFGIKAIKNRIMVEPELFDLVHEIEESLLN